jgi:lipopolysaccharide export LptBFGC system permease protein LptF
MISFALSAVSFFPVMNIEPRRFFPIRNIKLFADSVDKKSQTLHGVFLYQVASDGRPTDRVYARTGTIDADEDYFRMNLNEGQLQRYDALNPNKLVHSSFGLYQISIPLKSGKKYISTRYRNFSSHELRKMVKDLRIKGIPVNSLLAENSLRYAMAFAPVALILVGLPLATVLKRGGKTFGFGISIGVIFSYYLLLIMGLTLAEKGILPSDLALWIANFTCLITSGFLIRRMLKQ